MLANTRLRAGECSAVRSNANAAASPRARLIAVSQMVRRANICPSRFSGARSRSHEFHAQVPMAPRPQSIHWAPRNVNNAPVPVKNAVPAITPNMRRPAILVRTEMRFRVRRRSTSRIAGSWSSCARNGALARIPIMRLEAPRCSAKAVRITPVVSAAAPPENAASTISSDSPRSRSCSLT
jgi:hypothetical protein